MHRCPWTPIGRGFLRNAMLRAMVVLLSVLLSAPMSRAGHAADHHVVLVVHSYSTRIPYGRRQQEAIQGVLARMQPVPEVWVTHLDLDSPVSTQSLRHLSDYLRLRYPPEVLSAVLTTDTPAFKFMLEHGRQTFGDVPWIFSAARDVPTDIQQTYPNSTGVEETVDPAGTIGLIRTLQPDLKRLYIVTQTKQPALFQNAEVRQAADAVSGAFEVIWLEDQPWPRLKETLNNPGSQSAILYVSYDTALIKPGASPYAINLIYDECRAPIYALFESQIQGPVVGGVAAGGGFYGEASAKLAQRLLLGEPIESMPVVRSGVNRAVMNASALARWGIDPARVPVGVEFRNVQPTFFEKHGRLLVIGTAVTIAQSAIIGALLYNRRKRRVAEQRLQAVSNSAPVVIFRSRMTRDEQISIEYASEGYRRLFGVEPDFRARPLSESTGRYPPDSEETRIRDMRASAKDLLPLDSEISIVRPDGSMRWVRVSAQVSRDADGSTVWNGVVQDITERRHAEKALRESEERFRALGENLPGMTYTTLRLPSGHRVAEYLGPGLETLVGVEEGARIRADLNRLFDRLHPDDAPGVIAERIDSADKRRPFDAQYRFRVMDGSWRWMRATATPTVLADGTIRWHGVMLDIDDAKRAELALKQSEERFRALGENLPGLAFTTLQRPDGSRVAEYLGPGLESLIGPERGAGVRESIDSFLSLIHPDDLPKFLGDRQRAIIDQSQFDGEYRLKRPDDSWRWVRATVEPRFLDDGSICWHGLVLDITPAKTAEQALHSRERILHAIAQAGRRLAQAPRALDEMNDVVALLGAAAGADRAYLYERRRDASGGMFSLMTAEWTNQGVPSQMNDPKFAHLPDSSLDRARRFAPMARGETIVRNLSDCTGDERAYFEIQNLNSVIVAPVMLDGRWWGFLGFDACRPTSSWSPVEIDALRTAAGAIAASLERAEREASLRESEEQYRLVFEATNDAMWDWDIAANTIRWSHSFAATFGSCGCGPITDASGCFDRIHPEDVRRVSDGLDRLVAGDVTTWRDEYRFRREDGTYAIVADRASAVRDPSGKALRLIGAMSDVTALRDTERRLRAALEAGSMATWEWDLDAQIIHHSDGMGPMFNLPARAGSTPQHLVVEQIVPEDRAIKLGAVHGAFEHADGLLAVDYRVRKPDGSIRWLSCQGRVMQREGNGTRRLFGVTLDITRLKDAQAALRQSEERYRYVFQATNDVIWDWDIASDHITWSESLQSSFGTTGAGLVTASTDYFDRIHPADRERVRSGLVRSVGAPDESWREEYRFRRADGSYAWVVDRAHVVRDERGGAVRVIGALTDVSTLRETERRLSVALEAGQMAAWDWDVDRGVLEHSIELCPMFSMPPSRGPTPGAALVERILPEDRPLKPAAAERALRGPDATFSTICRVPQPDGTLRWIACEGRAVHDDPNHPRRIVGVSYDITHLKKAEEALRESEARLRAIIEVLPIAVLIHDGKSILFANHASAELFRCRGVDQLLRTTMDRLIAPAHLPACADRSRLVLGTGQSADRLELKMLTIDGAPIESEIRCTPIVIDGVRRVQTTVIDLTERRQAEQALRESDERFRQITENAAEVFWLADVGAGALQYISPAFESVWGQQRDRFIAEPTTFFDTIHPDDCERARRTASGNTKGFDHEYRIVRPDGTIRWVRDRAYPVRDASGRTVRIAGVAQDITESKAAEQSLHRTSHTQQLLLSELDHRVKNSLSSLLTLIDLTRAATSDIQSFADSIRARVLAMASVHTLLSEGQWAPVPMARVIASLQPKEARCGIEASGPNINVPARQVTALAMIIQELFTNSLKHGAAEQCAGRIDISWVITVSGDLVLNWNESGGPTIIMPVQPGVGTRLIQGFCKFELNGRCEFNYSPEGVAHRFTFRLDTESMPVSDVKPAAYQTLISQSR